MGTAGHVERRDLDLVTATGLEADLHGQRVGRTQQVGAVELGGVENAIDLALSSLYSSFSELRSEALTVPFIACTPSSRAHALQHVGDFVERAFCSLQQRDAVIGVAVGLFEATDLRGEALRDRQTGRVVLARLMRRPDDRRSSEVAMLDCEFIRTRCEFSDMTLVLITVPFSISH